MANWKKYIVTALGAALVAGAVLVSGCGGSTTKEATAGNGATP